MNRPGARLVLLDEPFRGLTREQRRALLDRARRWWQHATMLCVTHDVSDTRSFDRVLIVEGGRVIEQGAPAELAAAPGSRYRALLEADAAARQTVWANAAWTHLTLTSGRIETSSPARVR